MLGDAEVVPLRIGHRRPLDVRDLVEDIRAVRGAEPDEALDLIASRAHGTVRSRWYVW